jgi:hypothetical protein
MPDNYKTSHLIDTTSMACINSYLHKRFVQGIIHVKDTDLGYIGDLCTGDDPGHVDFMQKLIAENKIEFWQTYEQSTIPPTNSVDVILCQPYYLVKDKKKTH